MKTKRNELIVKAITWILAEVVLNLVGLDNLADYSEFVFDQNSTGFANHAAIATTLIIDRCNIPVISA